MGTHITENEHKFPIRTLCGRTISTREQRLGQVVMGAIGGLGVDEMMDVAEAQSGWIDAEWISVADFVGGDDSPDCMTCLIALNAALDRYWGDDE